MIRLTATAVVLALAGHAAAMEAADCTKMARPFAQAAASMRQLATFAETMDEAPVLDRLAAGDDLRGRLTDLREKRLAMLPDLLAYVGELDATAAALKACAAASN